MTTIKKTDNFDVLFDAIAEDVMALDDEELAQELSEQGSSIEEAARSIDKLTQHVRDSEGLRRLAKARKSYDQAIAKRRSGSGRSGDFARRKLEELSQSHGLMRAARNNNGEDLSDHDAMRMLDDMEELLGLSFNDNDKS